jgi:hypothetical protein
MTGKKKTGKKKAGGKPAKVAKSTKNRRMVAEANPVEPEGAPGMAGTPKGGREAGSGGANKFKRSVGKAAPVEPEKAPGAAEGNKFKRSVGKAAPVEPEKAPGAAEGTRVPAPGRTASVVRRASEATGAKQTPARKPLRLTESGKRKLVTTLIAKIGTQVEEGKGKASLADLIRLLQLEKELTPPRPRKITVQWVPPKKEEE